MTISEGTNYRIETDSLTVFICKHNPKSRLIFSHSDLEILEVIFERLELIDLDLLFNYLNALDGKYLSSKGWNALIETVRDFKYGD